MTSTKELPPYKLFDIYCLRTPIFSLDFYLNLHGDADISDELLKKMFADTFIREAIYTASDDLFHQLEKWVEGTVNNPRKTARAQFSFLKYLNRMSTRSTPFGLFASCALGQFSDETAVSLGAIENYEKDSQLDILFSSVLSQRLSEDPELNDELLFYPNSSLYKIPGQYRYVEYIMKEDKREYLLQSVTASPYLAQIIGSAEEGKSMYSLSRILTEDGFDEKDSMDFIESLISNQLLVSDVEPTVTGSSNLNQLIRDRLAALEKEELFQNIRSSLQELSCLKRNIRTTIEQQQNLKKTIKRLDLPLKSYNLLQTDLYTKVSRNHLNSNLKPAIVEILSVLNKISVPQTKQDLENFKQAFVKRYDQREVELGMVLDPELGIGYGKQKKDNHPFLEDIHLPQPENKFQQIRWTPFDDIMLQLLNKATRNNEKVIILQNKDLASLKENWEDLPNTFSAIIEVYKNNDQEQIYMNSAGGSSAANLLARFCLGNDEINAYVESIIKTEEQLVPDQIFAEIVHLPQVRTGNILRRPALRKYEIPYLAQSSLERQAQIPINDILVSVKGKKIILRSKRLKKALIPRLTNAHNYSFNALPLYYFLSDLQTQDLRGSLGFQWNPILEKFDFLPRIQFREHILSKARWSVPNSTIKEFLKLRKKELPRKVLDWRNLLDLPRYVNLVDGDNKLLIDLENYNSVHMFLKSANRSKRTILEEFLFVDEGIVKKGPEKFCNEFVVSFHKETTKK